MSVTEAEVRSPSESPPPEISGEKGDGDDDADFEDIYAQTNSRWDPAKEIDNGRSAVGCRLFVRGLAYGIDREGIRAMFTAHGALKQTGGIILQKSRAGMATIEYDEPRGASAAILALDGQQVRIGRPPSPPLAPHCKGCLPRGR